jgi:hypothetical protein
MIGELGRGQPGERWRDNQGDVWEWRTNRWVCDRDSDRWTLYPTDESSEFGPFTRVS